MDFSKIKYTKLGNGEPLIFLHGVWNHSGTYIKLIKEFSNFYTVYALDLPGFGRSLTPEKPLSFEEYAEFLSGFVETLGLNKITLVGHSGSGGVAIVFASSFSKQLDKLFLID
ncbi:MAG: hypothetical protein CMH64_01460 [Nanoarchaeota archaeon]|nr:hypothetical protein [Nanoarchaeota archaeon]|tara:strand:+ start:621 stop:959 length:339 start_codon:yes stop_codon:yes gene_type:complete